MSNPSSDSYRNPLRYQGQDYSFAPRFYRPRDPINPSASPDIKPKENVGYYPLASLWSNSTNGNLWVLVEIVNNLAKWILISQSTGTVLELVDDVGGVASPNAQGQIVLTGQVNNQSGLGFYPTTKVNLTGSNPNSIGINPMSPSRWIVDSLSTQPGNGTNPNGTHNTISSALASATAGDTIFIMDGIYTENINLVAGVNLVAFSANAFNKLGTTNSNVIINGTVTCNYTGNVSISGICFQTNNVACLTSSSGAPFLNLVDCAFNVTNAIGITGNNASWLVAFSDNRFYNTTLNQLFQITAVGALNFRNCEIRNDGSATTACSISAGSLAFINTTCTVPINAVGGSIISQYTIFSSPSGTVPITLTTSGASTFQECIFTGGTSSCISVGSGTILNIYNSLLSSSNTNVIAGSGTVNYGGLVFSGSSSGLAGTLSLTASPMATGTISLNNQVNIYSGTGPPNFAAPQGSLFLATNGSSTSTRAYINKDGTNNWAAVTTAS